MLTIEPNSTLVIATHNQGKLREIDAILRPVLPDVTLLSAGELKLDEPIEDGSNFAENAAIKSKAAAKSSGHYALADDSGLEVDCLDGNPGIYSARWAGESKDFYVAMKKVRDAINDKGLDPNGQYARFICVLALSNPDGETIHFKGTVEGNLCFPPRGEQGFGYDPIFIPNAESISFGEMEATTKHAMSHRANAFARLVNYLETTSNNQIEGNA